MFLRFFLPIQGTENHQLPKSPGILRYNETSKFTIKVEGSQNVVKTQFYALSLVGEVTFPLC
jgi:hypothetical protein